MPRVSVLCAFRNESELIKETIESINAQTFRDFEAVFVDDGSSDGSSEIVSSIANFPHVIIRNEIGMGLAAALNKGLRATSAPLIARVDADDLMLPHRLAVQVRSFEESSNLAVLGGQAIKINDEGEVTGFIRVPTSDRDCRFALNFYSPIIHPSAMFRRQSCVSVGGYKEAMFPAEDFDLWSRLAVGGQIGNHSSAIIKYRVRSSGSITTSRRSLQLARHVDVVRTSNFEVRPSWGFAPIHALKLMKLLTLVSGRDRSYLFAKMVKIMRLSLASVRHE